MQDAAESSRSPAADDAIPPPLTIPPPRRRGGKATLLAVLLAFLLGGAVTGWLVRRGDLDAVLPVKRNDSPASRAAAPAPPPPAAETPAADDADRRARLGDLETRLALLEDRFSRIGLQADAAGANASRAEALLIAAAARRRIEKGQPLGYIEDQLKVRFGGSQPKAVQTIIDASRQPVTLHLLSSQLEAAAPTLSGKRHNESTWSRISRELSSLFVVRRSTSPAAHQVDRVERAQILLKAGKIDDAVAEVERMPGAADAADWIGAARRYEEAQRALEIIETAAMLEPRRLRDSEGAAVNQPSPLAPPAEKAASASK